jgi:hypothetical protein
MAAQMSDNFAAVAGRVILNSECIRFEGKRTKTNYEETKSAKYDQKKKLRALGYFVVDFLMTSAS